MACRLPGAPDLHAFWRMLVDGLCGLGDVPADRFPIARYHDPRPGAKGRIVCREGGFIPDLAGFDAGFFHVSPREASFMDPQQRHLLEVAWQAIEDANLPPEQVDGARAAVFVGLFTGDYRERMFKRASGDLDVYCEIGTTRSSAAGRIAFALNVNGPTVAVDGACASSLLAVHLAANTIRSGEAEFAIAAGCNVVLEPDTSVCFSRSRMLSPESRCRFGDADAAGFVRSDGVGVVVLKPLSRALADGDRIYALVRASGSNNDARAGGGLFMTPSPEGQKNLLRHVYLDGGLDLDALAYVEAHGTGTRAGDPVECGAIAKVIGARRRDPHPLYVGSVKTNVGHTEGAAGVTGFIKTALSLHHRTIPASLGLRNRNPDIPWEEGRLEIPTAAVSLADRGTVLAGVSSFGLSGANAHVVLETFTAPEAASTRRAGPVLLPVSGHTPAALRARVEQLRAWLGETRDDLRDIAYTAGARRAHHAHRVAFTGSDPAALVESMKTWLESADATPSRGKSTPRVVMVFPGQGGQWAGMGRALREAHPACREAIDQMDPVFARVAGWSIAALLDGDDTRWMTDIERVQPGIFAVQVAMAALWRAYGVTPSAVIGHSMGEVAAAHVAGALSLEDAVRVIVVRSRCLAMLRGRGQMAMIGVDPTEAAALVRGRESLVSVAVSNARSSTVISGDPGTIEEILREVTARGVYGKRVDVDAASHSPQIDEVLGALREGLAAIRPTASAVPILSTVDAAPREGDRFDPEYWCANMRRAVRFWETTRRALTDGCDVLLEVGPHPVLIHPMAQTLREQGGDALVLASMRRDEPGGVSALAAAGELYARGQDLAWRAVSGGGRCVALPSYPFQHERYWFEDNAASGPTERRSVRAKSSMPPSTGHPFLPRSFRVGAAKETRVWELSLSVERFPYLQDHRVRGSAILPGAAMVEAALAAATDTFPGRAVTVEDMEFRDYVAVPGTRALPLQFQLEHDRARGASFRAYSFDPETSATAGARLHAVGRVSALDESLGESHTEAPTGDAKLLLGEQLQWEIERRRSSPGYDFALLRMAIASADPVTLEAVERRLRELVRQRDVVLVVAPGVYAVVLKNVGNEEHARLAVSRVGALLRESLAHDAATSHVTPWFERVAVDPDVPRLVDRLLYGAERASTIPRRSTGPERFPVILDGDALYQAMENRGVSYGATFRAVRSVERVLAVAYAVLNIPAQVVEESDRYLIHPAVLDACFQAGAVPFIEASADSAQSDTFLPVGVRRLLLRRRPEGTLHVRAWRRETPKDRDDEIEVDLRVFDEQRNVVLEVDGFRLKRFERRAQIVSADSVEDWFYRWSWEHSPCEPRDGARGRVVSVIGDEPEATSLRGALREAGVAIDGEATDVVLWPGDGVREALGAQVVDRCAWTLDQLRDVRARGGRTPRVWIVTTGARHVLDGDAVSLAQSAQWGIARVLANEVPEADVRAVDVPASPTTDDLRALAVCVRDLDAEDELAVRHGRRLVHRLSRRVPPAQGASGRSRPARADEAVALTMTREGSFRHPAFRVEEAPTPGADEVVVRVDRVAFDPSRPPSDDGLAAGCVGRVASVGRDVRDLHEGDRVVAWVPPDRGDEPVLARRFTRVTRALVALAPASLDDARAAQVPAAFLTPWVALRRLGALSSGDRVLVRDASSATGLAALAVARTVGAEVFATATSIDARAALRERGVEHVLDERAADLREQVLDLTGRDGVDVVLRAGPEAGLEQSFEMLAAGGRLLDAVGESEPTDLGDVPPNVSRCAIDMVELAARRPGVVRGALEALVADASRYALGEIPIATLSPERMGALLDMTARSTHATLDFAWDAAPIEVDDDASMFERDATYVITGGTGGLGVALARWLVQHGAGHVALLGRRGALDADGAKVVDEIRASGAAVVVVRADVADRASLSAAFASLATRCPTVRGVFHLAAVLDDATIDKQDRAKLDAVMAPKVLGAIHLDALTRALPLKHFVMFSSSATTIGSPGQANYAAANAFLDALAWKRHAEGLPALSVQWGVWADVGLAAHDANRGARLESRGLLAMSPDDALRCLGSALTAGGEPEVGVFAMDWTRWARAFPRFGRLPRVAQLVGAPEVDAATAAATAALGPRAMIVAAPDDARTAVALEYLRKQMADVLRMPLARIGAQQAPSTLGMDSLMTVELRGRLQDDLQVDLSPAKILAAASVEALADTLARALAPNAPGAHDTVTRAPQPAPAATLDPSIVMRARAASDPGDAFLTGATGFLGAHLLRELIDRTTYRVRCLVRGERGASPAARIRDAMDRYGIWRPADADRIAVVEGDLGAPRFGLDATAFAKLADEVGVVFHSGAWVNHLFPHAQLQPVNVGGTQEVLRLTAEGRRKVMHHVSTLVVFPFSDGRYEGQTVTTATPLADHAEPFFAGYASTKREAEQVCLQARARGIPVSIHRPAQITGNRTSFKNPAGDAVWRLVSAVLAVHQAPALRGGINLTPVDGVARAIVALARNDRDGGLTHHLMAPESLSFAALYDALRAQGHGLDLVPPGEWVPRARAALGRTSPAAPILDQLQELDLARLDAMHFACAGDETFARLSADDLDALRVTPALFAQYLRAYNPAES